MTEVGSKPQREPAGKLKADLRLDEKILKYSWEQGFKKSLTEIQKTIDPPLEELGEQFRKGR